MIMAEQITHHSTISGNRWVIHNFRQTLEEAMHKDNLQKWNNFIELEFSTLSITEHTVWSDSNFVSKYTSRGLWSNSANDWRMSVGIHDCSDEKYISATLQCLWGKTRNKCNSNPRVAWSLAVESPPGEVKLKTNKINHTFTRREATLSLPFIPKNAILCQDNNGLLHGNDLILVCEMYISNNPEAEPLQEPQCKLRDDLRTLLMEKKGADLTLEVEGLDYPAHRAILAARSPVFEAMFAHDTQEKRESRIVIKDMSAETLIQLLEFLYTGMCSKLEEQARHLLPVADKYLLEGLKLLCLRVMINGVTPNNAVDYLVLAEHHCLPQLKKAAFPVLSKHMKKIRNLEDSCNKLLDYPELMMEFAEWQSEFYQDKNKLQYHNHNNRGRYHPNDHVHKQEETIPCAAVRQLAIQ